MSARTIRCGSSTPSLTDWTYGGGVFAGRGESDKAPRLHSAGRPSVVFHICWLFEPGPDRAGGWRRSVNRNIEVLWLLRTLKPDFKTIADFRRDNRAAFRAVFRQFVLLCRRLDLYGRERWRSTEPASRRSTTRTLQLYPLFAG